MIQELLVCPQIRDRAFGLERKIRARNWEGSLEEITRLRALLAFIEVELRASLEEQDDD